MSFLPARMKKIQFKIKALECSQDLSHYKSMGIFPDAQGQLTVVPGRIWSKFELVPDFMVVLITCKNEEDPSKNEGARVFTTLCINYFADTPEDNSRVGGSILSNFELIQAFMNILVICMNEDDSIKNE